MTYLILMSGTFFFIVLKTVLLNYFKNTTSTIINQATKQALIYFNKVKYYKIIFVVPIKFIVYESLNQTFLKMIT